MLRSIGRECSITLARLLLGLAEGCILHNKTVHLGACSNACPAVKETVYPQNFAQVSVNATVAHTAGVNRCRAVLALIRYKTAYCVVVRWSAEAADAPQGTRNVAADVWT